MSKKFLLNLPESEHQSLKIAAVQAGASMHTFIRDAIKEKIERKQTTDSLHASGADTGESAVLAKALNLPNRSNKVRRLAAGLCGQEPQVRSW